MKTLHFEKLNYDEQNNSDATQYYFVNGLNDDEQPFSRVVALTNADPEIADVSRQDAIEYINAETITENVTQWFIENFTNQLDEIGEKLVEICEFIQSTNIN